MFPWRLLRRNYGHDGSPVGLRVGGADTFNNLNSNDLGSIFSPQSRDEKQEYLIILFVPESISPEIA
jgi:hypothetical protein